MTSKTATVFGGTGFIGRYVVQRLAKAGYQVRVPTRNPAAAAFLRPMGDVGQVVPMAVSLRKPETIAAAVEGSSVVINLLGILTQNGRQKYQDIHVKAPGEIAKAATKAGGKKFVHISAIGTRTDSHSIYARTKAEGERAVRAGFPDAVILKPSLVFGPEDKFWNQFAGIASLVSLNPIPFTRFIPLLGKGMPKWQPVYVGDVADAVMAAITKPETRGQTYELGGPKVYTFRQLIEGILAMTHRKCHLLPLSWFVSEVMGAVMSILPNPPFTRDHVEFMKTDNVVGPTALTFRDLGISKLETVESIAPTYLSRFIEGGIIKSRIGRAA